jgi:hypothetical protein
MYNVTYISDQDLYLVTPPASYYLRNHTINGNPVPETTFTSKEKPVIKCKQVSSVCVGYEHKLTKETVTVEDYNSSLNKLTAKGNYNDDDSEWEFDTIEHEVEYKHFIRDWYPKYQSNEYETEIEYVVKQGMLSSGEEFIDSMLSIDSNQASLFVYRRNAHLRALFDKLKEKYSDAKWDIPTHSGLYYVKMNGEYLFSNNPIFKLEGKDFTNNLDECKAEKNTIDKLFKTTVACRMTVINGNINEITLADFKVKLANISNNIATIINSSKRELKQNAAANARTDIKQMIETLNEIALAQ